MIQVGNKIPAVTLMEYVEVEGNGCSIGPNPVDSAAASAGKTIALFALPGAFTPTCTTEQCPAFEREFDALCAAGADDVHCLSVNDAFVMYQWGKHLDIGKVKMLPDGSGKFTRRMGMLIDKDHLGFGQRSWRYAAVIDDGVVRAMFVEPGINDDGSDEDPYGESKPEKVLAWMKAHPRG